jgi:putative transposase
VGRTTFFDKPGAYTPLENILTEAWERSAMRLLSYVIMPNHWHLVVWPEADGALSTYVQWLTVPHVRRWHAHYHSKGTGPIYQGRFKSFPVQEEDHYLTVCRYVERNPLRANRVEGHRTGPGQAYGIGATEHSYPGGEMDRYSGQETGRNTSIQRRRKVN